MEITYGTDEISGIKFETAVITASYGTLDKAGRVIGNRFTIRPSYRATYRSGTMELEVGSFSSDLWCVSTYSLRDGKHFGPCYRTPSLVKGTLADAIAYVEKAIAKKAAK
jgi:hypothetical protein